MNLNEWSKITGIKPTTPTTEVGAVSVIVDAANSKENRKELWRLDDYKVGSVSGDVIWLVPNKKEYELGEFVCDMHYGIPDTLRVKSHIQVRCSSAYKNLLPFIKDVTDKPYTNKYAIVVEECLDGGYVAAYSYDDLIFGMFEFTVKGLL